MPLPTTDFEMYNEASFFKPFPSSEGPKPGWKRRSLTSPYGLITLKGIKMETNEWKPLNDIGEFAEAVAAGMEIENQISDTEWETWKGASWYAGEYYRARQRKPGVETFDDQLDAARYRWLKVRRATSLIINFFGSNCVNKTFADVEAVIDQKIGASKQPATKKVKSLCWRSNYHGDLVWKDEKYCFVPNYTRFPAGDIPGEVEE